MNMSGRRSSHLAASFNATLAGSQVQGLLDGVSMSSNEGVSGVVPQGPDQVLDDVTTHSSGMDHNDGQGPVRPEDLDHPHNIDTPNHPPGIPKPAVNYAELIQTAERYKQLLTQAQMQNLQNVQTIQALTANQNTMEAQMLTMQQNIQQLINTANGKEAEHARALEETENRVRQEIEECICHEAEVSNPVDPDEQDILEAEQKAAEEATAIPAYLDQIQFQPPTLPQSWGDKGAEGKQKLAAQMTVWITTILIIITLLAILYTIFKKCRYVSSLPRVCFPLYPFSTILQGTARTDIFVEVVNLALAEAMWAHFASVAIHPSQLRITGYPHAYDMHIIKLCCYRQLQIDWQILFCAI